MAKKQMTRLQVYLAEAELQHLKRTAAARGQTISSTLRQMVVSQLKHPRRRAASVDRTALTDPQAGEILATLHMHNQQACRTADGVRAEVTALADDLLLLAAMVDRLHFGLMAHLPEIRPQHLEFAEASADRRHHDWKDQVARLARASEPFAALDRLLACSAPSGSRDVAA